MTAGAQVAKGAVGVAKSAANAAKAIGLVTNPATRATLDATIKMLGEWNTVLEIVVKGCTIMVDVDTADPSFASKLNFAADMSSLAGGYILAFATAGGPVCIVIAGVLLTSGFLMKHRDVIVKELEGETVAKFNALTEDSAQVAKTWARYCGFTAEWQAFTTAFETAKDAFATAEELRKTAKQVGEAVKKYANAIAEQDPYGASFVP
jgi:hypothetical protein